MGLRTNQRRGVQLFLALAVAAIWTAGAGGELLGPEYRLSPGDALQVQIFGEPDMSGEYAIGPAGTVALPQLGQVYVRNMTLQEARHEIAKRLGELLRIPYVVLSINEMASSRKVYVSGYVEQQGPVMMPFGATVLDALAAAGTNDLSDLRRVRVTHPGQTPKTLDFSGLRTEKPIDTTERVEYGDIVYVPKVRDKIAVLGQVNNPTTVHLPVGEELTVLDALSRLAGGLAPTADRSSALLIRKNGPTKVIDLHQLLKEGDVSQNELLQPGDVLVVHEAANISVVGEVAKSATFRSGEPVTVLETLAQAGGFTPEADLEAAQIFSADGEVRTVDLEALWKEGDLTQNLLLSPGDVLVVPEAEPQTIMVVGAVGNPGVVNIAHQKERDVLRIITISAPDALRADLRRTTIYREEQQIIVDVQAMLDEGKLENNLELEPGDVVMVPEKETLYVLGAVGRQGKVAWEPDMSILDVLAEAGGTAPRARQNSISIVRTRADDSWEHVTVSIGKLGAGIPPEPVVLKPGDIVYVPARGARRDILTLVREALWTFGAIAGILH